MAEALLRHYAADRVTVTSAGTRPGPHLHPEMVRVMGDQYGIDSAGRQPRDISTLARSRFDHVVTLCDRAREVSPEFAHGPRRAHWSICAVRRIAETLHPPVSRNCGRKTATRFC